MPLTDTMCGTSLSEAGRGEGMMRTDHYCPRCERLEFREPLVTDDWYLFKCIECNRVYSREELESAYRDELALHDVKARMIRSRLESLGATA